MELSDYLAVLRDRWRVIVLLTAIGTLAAGAYAYLATPQYSSTAQVFVTFQPSDPTSQSNLVSGSDYAQSRIGSYVELATSPAVLQPVIDELGLLTSPQALAASLHVTRPAETMMLNVQATSEAAEESTEIANAVATSMTTVIPALEQLDGAANSPVKLTIVRSATVPSSPISPDIPLILAVGVLSGLVIGVALALLRNLLDTKVRTERDVKAVTDAAVIGTIGFDGDASAHPLIVQTSPHSPRSEAFRSVRTNLQFLDVGSKSKSFVITSAVPGEGKSTTSINLAISLADAGSRVVLVDADLRRPALAEYMGLEREVGLTTILIGRAKLQDVVQPWGNGRLHVVTSGQIPPNPSELLGSRSMSTLLEELALEYDIVLLDSAPLLPVTDGAVLAALSSGAVVVAASDKIHQHQLEQALARLTAVGAQTLGVILNRVAVKDGGDYTYYRYDSEPTARSKSRASSRGRDRQEKQGPSPVPRHAVPGSSRNEQARPAGERRRTWPELPARQDGS